MAMRVFTAANRRYAELVAAWAGRVRALGMSSTVYDLGGLGYGIPSSVADREFYDVGVYRTSNVTWPARALHKPRVVIDHLRRFGGGCYLDADAIPIRRLDLSVRGWDIAVTVRRSEETARARRDNEFLGEINAGVLFFVRTSATVRFLSSWSETTAALGSDQRALNQLIGRDLPRNGRVVRRAGVRVLCLPTDRYNFYYFPERPPADTRVLHLKNERWRAALDESGGSFDLERLYARAGRQLVARPRERWHRKRSAENEA